MKFYNRQAELDVLNLSYQQITDSAKMVVMTGRRRVGKTVCALKHAEDKPSLYLFVAKKSETLLCKEYIKQIQQFFDEPIIGEITQFKDVFALLLQIAKKQPFVLIIDEFQEFLSINPSVYSDLQQLWDLNKASSQLQVLFLGSVYSLMHKIFMDKNEPLFGRADRLLHLKPFTVIELWKLLVDNDHANLDTFFSYYLYTGGVPKYIDMFLTHKIFNEKQINDYIFSAGSPLLDEGKNLLIEEFGKEYGGYFSILELISSGKTGRNEIESVMQKNIGGYLDRLEEDYSVIQKYKPIHAKPNSRLQKYHIKDHFLRFWFRFIYKNRTAVETGNYDYIKQVIERDISTYKGKILENLFYDLFAESKQYNKLGSYWERDGCNEIDLVAINDLEKRLVIAEIKLNKKKISIGILQKKAVNLIKLYASYTVEYKALSFDDIPDYLSRSH